MTTPRAGLSVALSPVIVVMLLVVAPPVSHAAVGDLFQTVNVAAAADCSPDVGTSVALVQGSKIDVPQLPIALVTTCFSSGGSATAKTKRATLYFIDPGVVNPARNGAVVKTIVTKLSGTTFAPGNGWAQLAHAANKGLLYGCGSDGSVYSIDYSVFSSAADGTTVAVTSKPSALTGCAGLAWDANDRMLYQSAGARIYFYSPTTSGSGGSFDPPAGCTVTGLNVVGGVLLIACNGSSTVNRVAKLTGAPLNPNPTITFALTTLSDLECDPVSYGLGNIDVVWSKNSATDQVMAYRVPAAMCGLPPKATVLAPAACPAGHPEFLNPDGSPKDTDGDGLWDCWEDGTLWNDGKPGIDFDGDGARDLILCVGTECATPTAKNIFVEIDFMEQPDGTLSHRPDPLAVSIVKTAFATAPVDTGIGLHVLVDDVMPHKTSLALEPCTGPAAGVNDAVDFDSLKASFFGTAAERQSPNTINAKFMAFRYMVWGHTLVGSTSSGCSETPGDDAVIALGGFGPADATGHKHGTTDQQAGTFMHELGHNLGLRHGGPDNVNCKPNYLSVMNYSRQFKDFTTNRPVDYSRSKLPDLNESSLQEIVGIGLTLSDLVQTVYGVPFKPPQVVPPTGLTATSIDWNLDGATSTTAADINKLTTFGCDGSNGPPAGNTVLVGADDWGGLQYNSRASLDFGAGRTTTASTATREGENTDKNAEQELASFVSADHDSDGIEDAFACGTFNANQPENPANACAIDIKPGTQPKILNTTTDSLVSVKIISTATFDAVTQIVRNTLTLNQVPVILNPQNQQGTCNAVTSTQGRMDLVCQFPASALPLGTNYSILEGRAVFNGVPRAIRARDAIAVR